MAQETLKELKYNGSKVIAECARRDDEGNKIASTYLTDVQIISEDEINKAFETVFGKNTTTTVKKLLDATKSAEYLFYEYESTSVDGLIKYNDTSNVTSMNSMFNLCSSLTTIPLLDTSKVTDMRYMFNGCSNLTTIPQLDTSKVTNMRYMFYNCANIEQIHMIHISTDLDISSCTKMEREALLEVLGNLKDLTGLTSKKLTLGSTLLAKLTEEDKLIATNKNRTLA